MIFPATSPMRETGNLTICHQGLVQLVSCFYFVKFWRTWEMFTWKWSCTFSISTPINLAFTSKSPTSSVGEMSNMTFLNLNVTTQHLRKNTFYSIKSYYCRHTQTKWKWLSAFPQYLKEPSIGLKSFAWFNILTQKHDKEHSNSLENTAVVQCRVYAGIQRHCVYPLLSIIQ